MMPLTALIVSIAAPHGGLKLHGIDAFNSKTRISFSWDPERASERASKRMSAAERVNEASSAEQADDRAVRVNERAEEQMARYTFVFIRDSFLRDSAWIFIRN